MLICRLIVLSSHSGRPRTSHITRLLFTSACCRAVIPPAPQRVYTRHNRPKYDPDVPWYLRPVPIKRFSRFVYNRPGRFMGLTMGAMVLLMFYPIFGWVYKYSTMTNEEYKMYKRELDYRTRLRATTGEGFIFPFFGTPTAPPEVPAHILAGEAIKPEDFGENEMKVADAQSTYRRTIRLAKKRRDAREAQKEHLLSTKGYIPKRDAWRFYREQWFERAEISIAEMNFLGVWSGPKAKKWFEETRLMLGYDDPPSESTDPGE